MMKAKLKLAVCLITLLGLGGCDELRTFPKHIQEFPEPWQVLAPGKPVDKPPRIEIVTEGEGARIEPGDLVQIIKRGWSIKENKILVSSEWWIWIGFRSSDETAFYASNPAQRAALLGLKEGSVLKFLEHLDPPKDAGEIYINPFGDYKYYAWRKNKNEFGKVTVVGVSNYAYSLVEIKRVCKGQLKYRTVRLFDDSPTQICSGLNCYTTTEKREVWADEAKIEARCPDNKIATFEYGPVGSNHDKKTSEPIQGYFDRWFYEAWKKLPVGVQLK